MRGHAAHWLHEALHLRIRLHERASLKTALKEFEERPKEIR